MALVYHDEVELEDFEWDEDEETFYYPCPCGDRFAVTKEELLAGEEVATCPSCSLIVKVSVPRGLHSTEVAFLRLTQRPRVRFLEFPT